MGKAHLAMNEGAFAAEAFSLAVDGVGKARAGVAGTNIDYQLFFEDKLEPYHGLVRLMIDQGKALEALSFAEKARARVLFDLKQQTRINPAQIMTAAERGRERELRTKLVSLNSQFLKKQARSDPGEKSANAFCKRLRR